MTYMQERFVELSSRNGGAHADAFYADLAQRYGESFVTITRWVTFAAVCVISIWCGAPSPIPISWNLRCGATT